MNCIYNQIPDAVRSAGKVHKAILLRALSTHLRDATFEKSAAEVDALFDNLRHISLDTLVTLASPALWLNVHRLYRATDATPHFDVSLLITNLQAMAFDSYWHLLEGRVIDIDVPTGKLLLPSIGYQLRGRHLRLSCASGAPTIERQGRNQPVTSDTEALPLSVQSLPSAPSLVVGELDTSIFDDFSIEAARGHGIQLSEFAQQLVHSLNLIKHVAPNLANTINLSVQWFVPLRSADPSIHRSHSSMDLPHVIFLSPSDRKAELAEAIVHEFGHNELNAIEPVCPLVDGQDVADFYSPWRTDRRPLRGLLHALFVFCGVSAFLRALDHSDCARGSASSVRTRRVLTMHRIRLGLKQVAYSRLAAGGMSIVKLIQTAAEECSAELGEYTSIPPEIESHWRAWRSANPELTAQGPSD
jgi:HEXXH motif-containing protein